LCDHFSFIFGLRAVHLDVADGYHHTGTIDF